MLHRIALAQTVPQAIAEDEPERARLLALAQQFTAEETQLYYQIAIHGRNEIDLAPDEYAGFTMTLLRMLAFAPAAAPAGAARPGPARAAPSATAQPPSSPVQTAHAPTPAAPEAIPEARHAAREPAEAPVNPPVSLDWAVLLGQLEVQGTARELAKNCTLDGFDGSVVRLSLAPQHKLLNSKMAQERLQAALTGYFAKPVKLAVTLGMAGAATPAVVEQRDKQTRQQLAAEAIAQDPFVREAQAHLGAQIIEDSIKPV